MFILTAKLNKKRLLALVILAAVALAALILSLSDRPEASAALGSGQASAKGIKTNEDRLAYVQSLGYAVEEQPSRSQEVMIPSEFDQVYQEYNGLQKECGFDLEKYRGKQVMLYTYTVQNYPDEPEVMLDLLVYRNRVIGGAVYSAALDGFMHGLEPISGGNAAE